MIFALQTGLRGASKEKLAEISLTDSRPVKGDRKEVYLSTLPYLP
jgi:hypothetical protein